MKPSIGRIVVFKHPSGGVSPAIVNSVNEDGTANVTVFGEANQFYVRNVVQGDDCEQWQWPARVE